jgi:hypothetical protein
LEAAEAFGNVLSHLNFSYQQRLFLSPNWEWKILAFGTKRPIDWLKTWITPI